MIDREFIESALNIRNKFLKLSNQLIVYKKDVKELLLFLQEKVKALEQIKIEETKKVKTRNDIENYTKRILKEIEEIEMAEKKLNVKVSKISAEMETLSKDEKVLFETIKIRHPELRDEEIINHIQSNLKK